MEIDLSPSRIQQPDLVQPVSRPGPAPAAVDTASLSASASLVSQLNNIPLARPEMVAQGQALTSDGHWPPDDVLDRIAVLLAVSIKPSN